MYEQTEEYIAEHCVPCPTDDFMKCKKYSPRTHVEPEMPAPETKRREPSNPW